MSGARDVSRVISRTNLPHVLHISIIKTAHRTYYGTDFLSRATRPISNSVGWSVRPSVRPQFDFFAWSSLFKAVCHLWQLSCKSVILQVSYLACQSSCKSVIMQVSHYASQSSSKLVINDDWLAWWVIMQASLMTHQSSCKSVNMQASNPAS